MWSTYAGKLLMTLLISMAPVLELRGAIPVATAHGLEPWVAITVSIVGNLIPVPFIVIFIRKIFTWMQKKSPWLGALVARMEKRAKAKSATVERCEFWGLLILVAIPLPGTGAWTGSMVAAMMDMRLKRAFPPIALGVTAAGLIVAIVTYGAFGLLNNF